MKPHIEEVNKLIVYHQEQIKRINRMMWVLIILAFCFFFVISLLLDTQVNRLVYAIQLAVENGMKPDTSNTTKMISASQDSRLGMLIIGMCAARLLVYFGEMRFHMRSLADKESYLISFIRINAALTNELDTAVKHELSNDAFKSTGKQETSLHLPSEAITQISDSILTKVESLISGKRV